MDSGLLRENFSARNSAAHCLAPPFGGLLEACRAFQFPAMLAGSFHG